MTDTALETASRSSSPSSPPSPGKNGDDFFLPDLCTVQAVLFLVLVAELLALVLVLTQHGLANYQWRALALTSLYMQWTVLLSAGCLCQLRRRLAGWPVAWGAALCYLVILVVAASTGLVGQWVVSGALVGSGEWGFDRERWLTNLIICAVLAGIALRYFYLTAQLQHRRQAELQARVEALQARIRPHFLFNSLNSIASLIPVNAVAAEAAIEDLAALFRASLADANVEVTVAQEVALCRRYLAMEALRLGPRLQVDWDIDELPLDLPIPGLSLQPLLENALYHGIQQLADGGCVRIIGRYRDGRVNLEVSNPVPPAQAQEQHGHRLAMDNIRHRVQAIYGDSAQLHSERSAQEYRVMLSYSVGQGDRTRAAPSTLAQLT